MKNIDLLKAMNEIDDDLILDASPYSFKTKKTWKNYIGKPSAILSFAMVLLLTIGIMHSYQKQDNDLAGNAPLSFSTLAEAQRALGFTIDIPTTYLNSKIGSYLQIDNILEIIYQNEDGDNIMTIRKAKGKENISGDYNVYNSIKEITDENYKIILKGDGDNDLYNLALWYKNDYSYALSLNEAVNEADMLALIKEIN